MLHSLGDPWTLLSRRIQAVRVQLITTRAMLLVCSSCRSSTPWSIDLMMLTLGFHDYLEGPQFPAPSPPPSLLRPQHCGVSTLGAVSA